MQLDVHPLHPHRPVALPTGFTCRLLIQVPFAPCSYLAVASASPCSPAAPWGPNYSRPAVAAPTGWKVGATPPRDQCSVLPHEWWTIFNDAELNSLEARAVEANQDLKRAVARVTEARALARVSKAELYPRRHGGGAYSRGRHSENPTSAPHQKLEYGRLQRVVRPELRTRLWGRVRRTVEAAKADADAVATDLQVVLLTLTADVARNYQLLRSLDNEKLVIKRPSRCAGAVALQKTRNQAGLINEVDVTRAKTELANVEAELHAVTRSRAQMNTRSPSSAETARQFFRRGESHRHHAAGDSRRAAVRMLQRRPDVVAAEQNLQAANARIGVAKAAFFPTIKLTGAAGFASADLGALVDWPSRFAQFGPSISVPIFQGGRNRANLKATEARTNRTSRPIAARC